MGFFQDWAQQCAWFENLAEGLESSCTSRAQVCKAEK